MSRRRRDDPESVPALAPPGEGVAWWQRLGGKYLLLPWYGRRLPWTAVPERMERQGGTLLALGEGLDPEQATRRLLVPPQVGLEDSSRRHSYAMVLEHLAIVGRAVAGIVEALGAGERATLVVRTAALKPEGRLSADAAREDYRAMLAEFRRRTLEPALDRTSRERHHHPWFGPLTALQWMRFAPFHQAVHLRQARAIRDAAMRRTRPGPA